MKQFDLHEPQTVPETVDLLQQLGVKAKVLGGGSDLVTGVMKDWVQGKGMPMPEALIDLTTVKDLAGIKVEATGARIGATTTLS